MAVRTQGTEGTVDYRYFAYDLMSNELLAEIPFKGVSYTRSLTEAGSFQGDIAVTEDTYNLSLYENTLPAKTALYVVRDEVCVWGGIIWNRSYSLVDKILSISATEFTSYLAHRVVWKTWNSSYEATAEISGNTMTATLTSGQYGFTVGELVYIYWNEGYTLYNGYFEVLSVALDGDAHSVITVPADYYDTSTGQKKSIPKLSVGENNPITIETRQDTYQYAKDLLRELNTDLFDFDFANDDIRPGIDLFNEIDSVSRTNNVATVVTSRKQELTPGQKISVSDVQADSDFNDSEAVVIAIVDDYTFTYANESPNNVATTSESDSSAIIFSFSRSQNVATLETNGTHDFLKGDVVYLENVSQGFDGYYTVYGEPASDTQFQVVMAGVDIGKSYTDLSTQNITGITLGVTTATVSFEENEFNAGQTVRIASVNPSSYNGDYIILSATDTSVTIDIDTSDPYVSGGTMGTAYTATAKRRGSVTYGTFGEHSTLGDIGFDLTESPEFSSNLEANPIIRGFELRTVYEVFEDYATKPGGFEYRVDCVYDGSGGFKKYFKFLPLIPNTLTTYLSTQDSGWTGEIPASAYGATDLVFEYPGNILEAQFDENAEDSATRFFVQGRDSRLNADASQPYSGASNHKLLRQGWPILDAVEDLDSEEENVLYKQALRLLGEAVPPISTFTISVNGSANPKLGTYSPGDWCSVKLNDDFVTLRAQSYLEQDYGTDAGVLVRKIIAYNVTVPDVPSYPEQVSLELVVEPAVPISGVTILDGKAFNEY
jgi:hypothetical protein